MLNSNEILYVGRQLYRCSVIMTAKWADALANMWTTTHRFCMFTELVKYRLFCSQNVLLFKNSFMYSVLRYLNFKITLRRKNWGVWYLCQDLTVVGFGFFWGGLKAFWIRHNIVFVHDKTGYVYIIDSPHWPCLLTLLMNIVG